MQNRVLFQALYQTLYQIFDADFIYDSYSSRNDKGTHRGVKRFVSFARKITRNWRRNAFVLKCDVRRFFDNVDHKILTSILARKITDQKLLGLLDKIINSFEIVTGKGLPLGNVTSQIFSNVYLNELDRFVKHELKTKYYIHYADDFVILDEKSAILADYIWHLVLFLRTRLRLEMHPQKVFMRELFTGTDFLGYVILPHRNVLRTRTKRRMMKRLSYLALGIKNEKDFLAIRPTIQSYFGMLSHCKIERIKNIIRKLFPILQQK